MSGAVEYQARRLADVGEDGCRYAPPLGQSPFIVFTLSADLIPSAKLAV